MSSPDDLRRRTTRAALRHLRADPQLAPIIRRVGPFRPALSADPFGTLVGSIVHQQVSMSAAAAIYRRLCSACGGRLTARAILAAPPRALRAAGLSTRKVGYVRSLADAFASRRLTAAGLRRLDDEAVIAAVTSLPGVGRWTAEMLLIFCLERPDVWPIDDFGLRAALPRLTGAAEPLPRPALAAAGEPWRPYRSYATWYLWRSLEGPKPPAVTH